MALSSKKHEKFYETTGTGGDKIDATKLAVAELAWAAEKAKGCKDYMADPIISPLVYLMQQMQDELDELRRYIVALAPSEKPLPTISTASHTVDFTVTNSKGAYTLVTTVVDSSGSKAVTKTASTTLR